MVCVACGCGCVGCCVDRVVWLCCATVLFILFTPLSLCLWVVRVLFLFWGEWPQDVEVEALRKEVDTLRKDLEISRLQAEISRLKGNSRPPTGASLGSRPPTGASYGRLSTADRMVLRSADGRPRVADAAGAAAAAAGGANNNVGAGGGEVDIAPVQLGANSARSGRRELTPAVLASHDRMSASRGSFGAGPPGDVASIRSYVSAASLRSVHSAYSYRSRRSAASAARRAVVRDSARRGPTPAQKRATAAAQEDLSAVMALPDRPPSALSRAGSAMLS